MDADDLIFSLTRIGIEGGMEGETSVRRSLAGPFKSIEKVDDYTARVILEYPNAELQDRNWMHIDIWPKKYFSKAGIEGFKKHPIGLGAFKWVEGDLISQVVLERNENYYGGCSEIQGEVDRIPALDRVIVNFIAEPTTRVAALIAGNVDIIQEVPSDSIELLKNNPNINVLTGLGTSVVSLAINTHKIPFNDKHVRQALAYALDYDLIVEKLYYGYSKPLYARPFMEPFPEEAGSGAFDEVRGYSYNPEKAKELLKEAGINDLTLIIDTNSEFETEAQAIAQMLSDIGIGATVRIWDCIITRMEKRGSSKRSIDP